MGGDLNNLIEQCSRQISVVNSISENCDWIQKQIESPHMGSQTDYDAAFNLICSAAQTQETIDNLRIALNSYLDVVERDITKLDLSPDQVETIESFIAMTETRPFSEFAETYNDLGRPSRIVPPVLTQQVGA